MQYVIGAVFALLVAALAVGAMAGRVQARSCCSPADPDLDGRMRAATPVAGDPEAGGEPTSA